MSKKLIFSVLALALIFVGTMAFILEKKTPNKLSAQTSDTPNVTENSYRLYEFFASTTAPTTVATTTDATSTSITPFMTTDGIYDAGWFKVAGAKEVTLFFSRGGATSANTGTSTFKVQVTADGTNWFDYNGLSDATTTVTSADDFFKTYSDVVIEAATSTKIMKMAEKGWLGIRCIVLETIDGEHRCRAAAEF